MNELRAEPGLRLARGLVTAIVAAGLGLAAHVGAGGLLPSLTWLAIIFIALAAVAIGAMASPAGLRRLVALVAGGQFATHLVLTALAGHAGERLAPILVTRPQSISGTVVSPTRRGSLYDLTKTHAGLPEMSTTPKATPVDSGAGVNSAVPHWLTHILEDLSGPNALMALTHFAAAVLIAWWLAQGEQALWRLIFVLGAVVLHTLSALAPAGASVVIGSCRRSRPVDVQLHLRWSLVPLNGGLARRGPPLDAD